VPKGLQRFYGNGDLHFITASCYHREPLLGTPRRRDLFLKVLEQVRERYQFVVVGYVVMPEHFHLLISEPEKADPSVVMQALKLGVVRRLFPAPTSSKKREESGTLRLFEDSLGNHFWQRRFYDFNVWSARKRVEKLRYRNPVKRGLVETPEQWRWSSFRWYLYGERGAVMINDWLVLKMKIRAA